MANVSTELTAFFETGEVNAETYDRLADLALASFRARERFAELAEEYGRRVEQGQGELLKLALCLLTLGRYQEALEWFEKTPDGKARRFFAAKAAAALGRFDQAVSELEHAAAKGWDRFDVDMQLAALHVRSGNLNAAEKLADKHAQAGIDRPDWYHVRGLLCEQRDDWVAAVEQYEKALALNPDHVQARFRCAWLYDIHGDDGQAIEHYETLAMQPRAYVNALINLAVIYEDNGEYHQALECLLRVLKAYPNHPRASLFLRDVESCRQMVLEEGGDERIERRNRLLDTPISEFELSMRARNCLKKMNVRTLGDLVRLTEAELLSFKNFGETSLNEIKSLLAKRGLRLGQPAEELVATAAEGGLARINVPPGREAILSRPVSELELSVRARRCLQRLNVISLGDLIQLTEADLLETRNFGVTSLNEVKARLAEHGLQLAPKPTN
jgi:DNA-directed RNA polymerase subunit alpha